MIIIKYIEYYFLLFLKQIYSLIQISKIKGYKHTFLEFPITARIRKNSCHFAKNCKILKGVALIVPEETSYLELSSNVTISSNVVLEVYGNLSISKNSQVQKRSKVNVHPNSKVHIGENFFLGEDSILQISNPNLKIGSQVSIGSETTVLISSEWILGKNTNIGDNCAIAPREAGNYGRLICKQSNTIGNNTIIDLCEDVTLEDYVMVGPNCTFYTHNHDYLANKGPNGKGPITKGKITIGRNSWIGANVIILPNVTIGENCVVAAGSVVTKSIEANRVFAGIPAKEIKKIESTHY